MKKVSIALCLFALLIVAGSGAVQAQRVTVTLAGTGMPYSGGFSGDGGIGTHATLNGPVDVCTDAARNIYFSDEWNGRIRMISAKNGIITTVAGGGSSTADGVPATAAVLTPEYMCIDAAGNLYVVTNAARQIKEINAATHLITTVAGTGAFGFSGDGGAAVGATFNGIVGIGIDGTGNLFLVDSGNDRVRKIAAGTGIITTIAGTGVSGYAGDGGPATNALLFMPSAITVDGAGNVFFVDQSAVFNSRIREINMATGVITTIAGNESGSSIFGDTPLNTWLGDVTGLCTDGGGNFYCNEISCSCRKIDMTTDTVYALGGNFSIESFSDCLNSLFSYMDNPYGICADAAQNVYVADKFNNRIRKQIQLTHTPSFAFGNGIYKSLCGSGSIDSQLIITDLDSLQMETWTVLTAPVHGSLSGFPATAASNGTAGITIPSGTMYTGALSYSGPDSFQVKVSDGVLSDIVTVYINNDGSSSISGPNSMCTTAPVMLTDSYGGGAWSTDDSTYATISSGGELTAIAAGTVTVIYTVTNSCGLVSYDKVITIDDAPPATAGIITGAGSVCPGAMITMVNATTGGVWSMSNVNASVSGIGVVSGSYTGSDSLIYTVANSCGSVATAAVIIINPEPVAGTIDGEESICKGSVTTMVDATAIGLGMWSASNTDVTVSATGVVTGISAGTSIIYYHVSTVCGSMVASLPVTINNCSALGVKTASALTPNVYPNPASSVLTIEWDALQAGNAHVSVADVTGRVVLVNTLYGNGNNSADLDVSGLQDGVYLLTIGTDTAHFTDKIVISR